MKKILIAILAVVLLVSCAADRVIVDDEQIVLSVQSKEDSSFKTKYRVTATSTNPSRNHLSVTKNLIVYYTNTLYSVGDTIRLVNKKELQIHNIEE